MPDTYLPGDTRQRIQDLIKNRKITQAELAEKVGLSNSALSRYLQGNTKNLGDREETAAHFHLNESRAKGIERAALHSFREELHW